MSGLQCEDVMTWTMDEVVNWIQKNNMGIFRPFISRECINGQELLQLDKKRLEHATEAKRSEKESLLKLLKNIGKEKDKKKIKMPSIWKGVKGANESATVPTSIKLPSFKPPQPPTEDEEFEEVSDPDEWDDDRGIYDNDAQPMEFEINPKGHRPADADVESENESEYVNPDEEFSHENDESHNVQESYYEEDTTSIQRTLGRRGAAPLPPIHRDEEELYEDPDHSVTASPPPLPPLPSAPSKVPNQRQPPPIPSDDFYEPPDPPMKVPPVKRSNYESAAIPRMPSTPKSRGAVPPAPTHVQQEQLPEKVPDRPPPRRPVPPPCPPVPEDDHDDPAPVRPLPPLVKRTVPVPCPPASLHPSPPQEIYEEAEEKTLPPGRRGSQGCVRPALPVPPSEDDDIYEPASDETLESRDDDDDDDVPVRSEPAATQPMIPGLSTINFGVSSIALRDVKGNLKKPIPKFNPKNSSTNNAANDVKGKCQETTQPPTPPSKKRFGGETTQKVQPRPSDVPKKSPPTPPSKKRFGGAPGGPDSDEPPRERAPPGAPPAQKPESRPSAVSHSKVTDPNDVTTQPWFFGDFSSSEAAVLLKKLNKDGTYLVRESKRSGHLYTLALNFREDIFNIPIRKRNDGKFALGSEKADEHVFETVNDMVRFHRNNAIEVSKEGKAVGKVKLAKIAEK